jgi:hypothetical protein
MMRVKALRRFYRVMMGMDDQTPEQEFNPVLKQRLEQQVEVLNRKIRMLENTVADATLCGVIVPDSVCQALYDARLERRSRVLILDRLNGRGEFQRA